MDESKNTSFFAPAEFACPCGRCNGRLHPSMLTKLNVIRSALGAPIRVTSGLRCQKYQENLAARGYPTAKFSPHVPGNYGPYGIAVDLTCAPEHFQELLTLCEREFKAIGTGDGWLHIDLRSDKPRRWAYSTRSSGHVA